MALAYSHRLQVPEEGHLEKAVYFLQQAKRAAWWGLGPRLQLEGLSFVGLDEREV